MTRCSVWKTGLPSIMFGRSRFALPSKRLLQPRINGAVVGVEGDLLAGGEEAGRRGDAEQPGNLESRATLARCPATPCSVMTPWQRFSTAGPAGRDLDAGQGMALSRGARGCRSFDDVTTPWAVPNCGLSALDQGQDAGAGVRPRLVPGEDFQGAWSAAARGRPDGVFRPIRCPGASRSAPRCARPWPLFLDLGVVQGRLESQSSGHRGPCRRLRWASRSADSLSGTFRSAMRQRSHRR